MSTIFITTGVSVSAEDDSVSAHTTLEGALAQAFVNIDKIAADLGGICQTCSDLKSIEVYTTGSTEFEDGSFVDIERVQIVD